MTSKRQQRLAERLQRELAQLINYELKDPRLEYVSVSRVEVSGDLRVARVFIGHLGDEAEGLAQLATLEHASGYLRREVGQRIRLRHVPELRFEMDRGLIAGMRIDALLQEIAENEPADPQDSGESDDEPTPGVST